MASLVIRLKRHSDSSASLTCTRADGSVTWQRQKPSLAIVFPSHDLTHYAVETTLGCRGGFFGLLADGWAITDFAAPWPRGPIPTEAREVEILVGLFEGMRRGKEPWTTTAFNEAAREIAADAKFVGIKPRIVSEEDIGRVTALRDELIARWLAVQPGDVMDLSFNE